VTDLPIIFSAPMIRALLEGRKTQTRRVLKLPTKGIYERKDMGGWTPTINGGGGSFTIARDGSRVPARETIGIWHQTTGRCLDAPWQTGDRLWVRETHQFGSSCDGPQMTFRATPDYFSIDAWDGPDEGAGPSFNYDKCRGADFSHWLSDVLSSDGPWRSPLHMPRWASRLTLIVLDVRVQRLHEITHADADAEAPPLLQYIPFMQGKTTSDYVASFAALWNSIHGCDAWATNPFVAALTFRVIRANIDAPEAANL